MKEKQEKWVRVTVESRYSPNTDQYFLAFLVDDNLVLRLGVDVSESVGVDVAQRSSGERDQLDNIMLISHELYAYLLCVSEGAPTINALYITDVDEGGNVVADLEIKTRYEGKYRIRCTVGDGVNIVLRNDAPIFIEKSVISKFLEFEEKEKWGFFDDLDGDVVEH